MPSQPVTEPTHAPPVAAEGLVLWPWGILAMWIGAGLLCVFGHPWLGLAAVAAVGPWFILQLLPIGVTAFGRGYRSFETAERVVWLTIDDGPDPATTPRCLDLLAAKGMKATFFLIGAKARAHPELVSRIVAEGHEIGCHTEHHLVRSFWCASAGRMRTELDHCADYLRRFGPVRYFRPPVGLKGPWLRPALGRSRLTLALWSARGLDGLSRPPEACLRRLQARTRPGGILLVHELSHDPLRSVGYVERVVEWLATDGFGTVLPEPARLRLATSRE